MQQYKNLVKYVLKNGIESNDRTGTGTKSIFDYTMKFDLQKGFPLVTLKKTFWKGVVIELLWILRGETNTKFLTNHNVNIWNEWADGDGNLGPVYGSQLRNFNNKGIDQFKIALQTLKNDHESRRIVMSVWNPLQLDKMALQPCHGLTIQFYCREGKLSCKMYQRSGDVFLGVPFNIASYALLTHLVANECNLEVNEFIHTIGDAHIYNNHVDQCKEMIKRRSKGLSDLNISIPRDDLLYFIDKQCHKMSWEEIKNKICLSNYKSHSKLTGKVSV